MQSQDKIIEDAKRGVVHVLDDEDYGMLPEIHAQQMFLLECAKHRIVGLSEIAQVYHALLVETPSSHHSYYIALENWKRGDGERLLGIPYFG